MIQAARRTTWAKIRRIWATAGILAFAGFMVWMLLAYRASSYANARLLSDADAAVLEEADHWMFVPAQLRGVEGTGLVFFPGALVDPAAYAPIAHEVAAHGFPALIIRLPWRGAWGAADGPEVRQRALEIMAAQEGVHNWVVAGHSRGGLIASLLMQSRDPRLAALVLIGTSHPRDFSLSSIEVPVTKVYGTNDGVAPHETVASNRDNLPASTRWVAIEGGNHSQFGSYGFQPGDSFATIDRDTQQRLTVQAILDALGAVNSAKK